MGALLHSWRTRVFVLSALLMAARAPAVQATQLDVCASGCYYAIQEGACQDQTADWCAVWFSACYASCRLNH